jgi:hypothetical protein
MKNKDKILKRSIYIVSIVGLIVCIITLFPQIRQLFFDLVEQKILHREISLRKEWYNMFFSYAMGGIFFIGFFDYCTLTVSGQRLVHTTIDEIKVCWMEIEWRSFIKPILLLFCIYLLGYTSIIRANFLYMDDIGRTTNGFRGWQDWSRYFSIVFSTIIQPDVNLTDISPLPQLVAILLLSGSSVFIVYILCDRKMTIFRLIASIPVGFTPYFLGCIAFKYDSPHMAMAILTSIIPFLFGERKKAFAFCSVVSLLIMYMTYQAASGIYILIVLILCFRDWNEGKKTNKELFSFGWVAVISFGIACCIFKFFLMKEFNSYVSNSMIPLEQMIPGMLFNIRDYAMYINDDLSLIWKIIIIIILFFFVVKSICVSRRKKIVALFVAIILLCLLFVLSYGTYLVLEAPLYVPRAFIGFGVFLALICVYVVSGYKKKIVLFFVFALNWCFFVFAFSYGNALADQMRYANFRVGILLHDLSALYADKADNELSIQLKNSIGYAPSIKNIAKHNPIIYRIVPQLLEDNELWADWYYLKYFNFGELTTANMPIFSWSNTIDFNTLDLPIVLKSYYHTIKSDGKRVLVELNEGMKINCE